MYVSTITSHQCIFVPYYLHIWYIYIYFEGTLRGLGLRDLKTHTDLAREPLIGWWIWLDTHKFIFMPIYAYEYYWCCNMYYVFGTFLYLNIWYLLVARRFAEDSQTARASRSLKVRRSLHILSSQLWTSSLTVFLYVPMFYLSFFVT